jgi:NitT/TauT family transport system substrate-binding protein
MALLLVGLLGSTATAADGGSQSLKKVVIGYSGISISQTPGWVAYEAGFFRKYGFDAQLLFVESGSRMVQTLISGDVLAAVVAGAPVIQSNLQGSGVVLVTGFLNTLDYKFIVSKDITRPDQLKGKAVAISRVGSSSDFATRYALEKYGLVPDKDVAILQIGSQPARFAALETGRISGVMIAIPLTAKAARSGLNTLADLQMLGLEYQHNGLAVSQNLIKTQPDVVRNLVKAYVESIHYMKTHRKETIAVLAKYLKTDDTEALEEAYEAEIQALIPEKPYPTLKGIQVMLREMGIKDPVARAARPEQFVNLTFMKELDSSGFIDRLYKSTAVAKAPARAETPVAPAPVAKDKPPITEARVKPGTTEEKRPAAKAPAPTVQHPQPAQPAEKAAGAGSAAQQYVVKGGDTLSKIALQFYNSMHKWEKIYEANRDQVKNPHYIYIGMKLIIPPDDQTS